MREPSVNRKYLQALTVVGPTRDNLVLYTLAVLHLNNRLYIMKYIEVITKYNDLLLTEDY